MVRKAGHDFNSKLRFQCLDSVLLIQSDQEAGFILYPLYLGASPGHLPGHLAWPAMRLAELAI